MSRSVLVLRPEPGASQTADRARNLGLDPVVAPLFEVHPLSWDPPEPGAFDALLVTSANAVRHGGEALGRFRALPCYCVGETTAAAARAAGFATVHAGPCDGEAALRAARSDGARRLLHLCGRDHVAVGGDEVERRCVYAAEAVPSLPPKARAAITEGALVLLHSPRAASLFASFVPDRSGVRVAAISAAAAAAAGSGWAELRAARAPRDEALLELAAELCQSGCPKAEAE